MFITIALIPPFMRLAQRWQVVDVPDARKVHSAPIPRCGGLAMAVGALLPVLMWTQDTPFGRAMLIGSWILVIFGLIDDWKGLNYKIKFASQIAAAVVMVVYGGVEIRSLGALLPGDMLLPGYLAIPLTILVIVGVTNAINLADGLDGLAGGISLLSFICVAYLAYRTDNPSIVVGAVAISGAIFGFLRYNTHPAVVFMGDAGSQFLGFTAISLSLHITQEQTPLSPLVPLLLLGFPVLDTLTVMLQRVAEGRSPFYPDKNHFHHKLMRLNLYQSEAVVFIYAMQAFLVTSAYYFRYHSEWLLLALYAIFSGLVLGVFFIADRTGWALNRSDPVDRFFRRRLSRLRDMKLAIKVCFRISEFGASLILIFACLVPAEVPRLFSYATFSFLLIMVLAGLIIPSRLRDAIRLCLYLTIPIVVYTSQLQPAAWISEGLLRAYNLTYGGLMIFVLLTLRLSRREGFKSTPMDFLILLIAVGRAPAP